MSSDNGSFTPSAEAAWSDQEMVAHCLAREDPAWCEFDHRYWDRMEAFAHRVLGEQGIRDANVAEDVAEFVLESLYEHDGRRLRAWHAERVRLFSYLCYLVRKRIQVLQTAWERRRAHETVLEPRLVQDAADQHLPAAPATEAPSDLRDVPLPRLTKSERRFLEDLLNQRGEAAPHLNPNTYRSKLSRILKKFPAGRAPEVRPK